MRVKFGRLVVPALLLVGGIGSSAHAQHLKNGNFNATPPTQFWTEDPPNLPTEVGVTGKCIWLNHSGAANHDPSVSQNMTDLTVGKTYVVVGQYMVGKTAPTYAKPGNKMLAVDIDGVVKTMMVAPTDQKDPKKIAAPVWLAFAVKFTATTKVHNLRIRGEIEGKDADVYVDEVSVSQEPDARIILNGSFDTEPSANDWTLEHIEKEWDRHKTETLEDKTTNKFFWLNGLGDHKDPAVVQTMKNLTPGKTYIISCQYRTGAKAEEFKAVPGTPMLAISVDGNEMNRGFAASAKGDATKLDNVSWSSLNTTFVATKTEHELKIRGEIDGHDGDVDLDNVSVVETAAIAGSNAVAVSPSQKAAGSDNVAVSQSQKAAGSDNVAVSPSQKAAGSDNVAVSQSQKAAGSNAVAVSPSQKAAGSDNVAVSQSQKAIEIDLGGVKMKMVPAPKAKFWMGGGADPENQNKQVQVEVGEFYIGASEVTQAQWKAVMGNNPSKFKGDDLPVETVSWNDAQKFIVALNEIAKETGYVYRLPTEAEWEYACRGGATSKEDCAFDFYFDQPTNDLSSDQANFNGDYPRGKGVKSKSLGTTVKVGSYKPNKLGLYDMHGNVWEWTDTLEGSGRVLRGAHWGDIGQSCKASARLTSAPDGKNENLGFRLAASVSNVQTKSDAMDIPKDGDAKKSTVDAGEYILTADKEEQHGGFWAKQPISFKESFKISAEIYLGDKGDSGGADGIALVFQDKGVVSVKSGGGIGYLGMTPSIAIEFDTHQNEELNDPAKNHVALSMNGDAKHAPDAVTKGDVIEINDNLEDNKYHPITFEWDAVKKTFILTLDGKQVFKDKTIPAHTMADNTISYGFTSATGGRSNEHKVRAISYSKR